MKTIHKLLAIAAVAVTATCCTDLSGVKEDIADLQSRVGALETQIASLNENVEAMKVLAGGGTLFSVEEKDGKYHITTSDGTRIVLTQGSIGIGKAPLMSIDAEGYWKVDYQDGNGATYVLRDGARVYALGLDGLTPKFSVDAEGYWTVSYDGGTTYVNVTDTQGDKVKAVADGSATDSYFADVKYEDETFTLTLKNGESYVVPVVKDFLCSITSDADLVEFHLAETKTFALHMSGVAETFLTVPEGWQASMTETILSVTAPATAPSTKATIADSRTDISILAISKQGFSAIARVRVQLSGTAQQTIPMAAAKFVSSTTSTISFDVTLEDATAWYWMVLPAAESAPNALRIKTEGNEGSGKTVTAEGLVGNSLYTIYVLPVNGETNGAIASASGNTEGYDDLYQAYTDGNVIVVAGKSYSKAVNGEAKTVSATSAGQDLNTGVFESVANDGGILFIDASDGASFSINATVTVKKDLVIIGRRPASKVKISFGASGILRPQAGIAISGVDIDFLTRNNYLITYNGANIPFMHFENCDFRLPHNKPIFYGTGAFYVESLRMTGNRFFNNTTNGGSEQLFNFGGTGALRGMKDIVFNDNICYSAVAIRFTVVNYTGAAQTVGTTGGETLTMKNNIFFNCIGNYRLFNLWHADNIEIQGNVHSVTATTAIGTASSFRLSCDESGAAVPVCILKDNISFGVNSCYASTDSKFTPEGSNWWTTLETNPIDMSASDPENGVFVMGSDYKNYGPQR